MFGMGTGVTPPLESPGSFEYLARPLLPLNFRVASAGTVLQLHSAKTGPALSKFKGQAARPISTRQLKRLRALHFGPINLVVYQGPLGTLWSGRSHLGVGFALRCFQRLSRPNVTTERCSWRNSS